MRASSNYRTKHNRPKKTATKPVSFQSLSIVSARNFRDEKEELISKMFPIMVASSVTCHYYDTLLRYLTTCSMNETTHHAELLIAQTFKYDEID
jgi:hypothetical protein